jgi:hypothetical protein
MNIDSLEFDINSLAQTFGISRSEAISEIKILFSYANDLDQLDLIKEPNVMRDSVKLKKYKKFFNDRLTGKPSGLYPGI